MAKRIIELVLLLIFSVTVLMLSSSCDEPCDEDPNICLSLKPGTCPGANLSGSILHINELRKDIIYIDPFTGHSQSFPDITHINKTTRDIGGWRHSVNAVVDNSTAINRYVEGYEINYGFWSQDSYRRYSYKEIFRWKYGRDPTPTELANMTDQNAKDWFIQKHTVKRSILPDSPPRDVQAITQPFTKFCITMDYDISDINGYIEFPNGQKCDIKKVYIERHLFDPCDNPNTEQIEISGNCPQCQLTN